MKRKKEIFTRGHPELNQGPLDLQSNALPLSYTPLALIERWIKIICTSPGIPFDLFFHHGYDINLKLRCSFSVFLVSVFYCLLFEKSNSFWESITINVVDLIVSIRGFRLNGIWGTESEFLLFFFVNLWPWLGPVKTSNFSHMGISTVERLRFKRRTECINYYTLFWLVSIVDHCTL